MSKNLINKILVSMLVLLPIAAYAEISDLGGVAGNLMTPVMLLSDFVTSAAFAIGICALFAAFLKYLQFRVNPLAHPIGTVIFLFVIGIILLCLPLLSKLTESGIPFSLNF